MKLSVWSSYYEDLSPEQALQELRAHGYAYCELSDEHALALMERGDPCEIGQRFGAFARELGIELSQGHLFLGAKIGKAEDRRLLKEQFKLFEAIGIRYAVLHCDRFADAVPALTQEELREKNCEALAKLLEAVKGTSIVICLENLRTNPIARSADDLMFFIDRFQSEQLAICLDTGHLNLTERDQAAFIRRAGKHIKALHIDDNEGKDADSHLIPYGCGNVDIETVVREMKSLRYTGLYNLEIPGECIAPLEIRGYKLDYIQKVFSYLDAVT